MISRNLYRIEFAGCAIFSVIPAKAEKSCTLRETLLNNQQIENFVTAGFPV